MNSHHPLEGQRPFREPETVLQTCRMEIERKTITLSLRENNRGKFLRIMEEFGDKRHIVIVPDSGFSEFIETLTNMCRP